MSHKEHNWKDCLEIAAMTDVGMRRANNQDAHTVFLAGNEKDWYQRGHVFIVADGMGAHAAGELASKLAVDNIPHNYHKNLDRSPPNAIYKAILDANTLINRRGKENPDFEGMGTTCSSLLLVPQGAVVAHVGDSRVYRVREGKIEQLTFDHSLVWEMMESGQFAEDQMPSYIPKNVITRSLGPNSDVKVDLEGPFSLQVGDIFLLCSDGLSGQIRDEEMGAILTSLSPEDAAQTLIDIANLRGGPDNITVEVVKIAGDRICKIDVDRMSATGDSGEQQIHPAAWGLMGIGVLGAMAMMMIDQLILAGLCFVTGLVGIGLAVVSQMDKGPKRASSFIRGPLGKGPYRSYDCPLDAKITEQFSEMVDKIDKAGQSQKWPIDWEKVNGWRAEAEAACGKENFAQAISRYCQVIRYVFSELRNHRDSSLFTDSSVEDVL